MGSLLRTPGKRVTCPSGYADKWVLERRSSFTCQRRPVQRYWDVDVASCRQNSVITLALPW